MDLFDQFHSPRPGGGLAEGAEEPGGSFQSGPRPTEGFEIEQLVITEGTIKNHMSSLFAKLELRDRVKAVLKAQEIGLI